MLKPSFWLILLVALYSVAQLTWYLDTPLGQSPALDGHENLLIAEQIREGNLPVEPFYRAMLYPALLAAVPIHWAVLGLVAHLCNTLFAYQIANRIWQSRTGAFVAGALVGFNPVLLHFAFDPLDITVATTLFLAAIFALQSGNLPGKSFGASVASMGWGGLLLALATLTRPHFLAVLVSLALVTLVAPLFRRLDVRHTVAFIGAALIPLVAVGMIQKSWSGSFQVLPWQGAYNLWVSNKPEANGLYYRQTLEFHHLGEHRNPNRMESEQLYFQERGHTGTPEQQATHWRSKTLKHISNHPEPWIELMLFKAYALLNNYEQYNNKTYGFHKSLSPWLKYNPISWGLLLILAVFSAAVLWRDKSEQLTALLFVSVCFAAGVALYMASARFRLPLVPLLAVFAGGLPLAFRALKTTTALARIRAALLTALAGFVAFSSFAGVANRDTHVQDMLLLADASARLGKDRLAIQWATRALEEDPDRQTARRLRLISKYNLAASGQIEANQRFWEELVIELLGITLEDVRLAYIRGVVLWNIGSQGEAIEVWRAAYQEHGLAASSSLGAILTVAPHAIDVKLTPELLASLSTGKHPILSCALASARSNREREAFLQRIKMDPRTVSSVGESLQRVLPQ